MNENLRKCIIATGGLLLGAGLTIWFLDRTERHEHHFGAWSNCVEQVAHKDFNFYPNRIDQWQARYCTNCNFIQIECH